MKIIEKDTVSKQDEDDEIDAVVHSTIDPTLRSNGVEHHFIPVFTRQNLAFGFTLFTSFIRQPTAML